MPPRKYVLDLYTETEMLECKPSDTLIKVGGKELEEPVDKDIKDY